MQIDFFPKQQQALDNVLSGEYNFLLYGGAIRGGKTIFGLGTLVLLCKLYPRSRWAVVRKNLERIRRNTLPSFQKMNVRGRIRQSPMIEYVHPNGSTIMFLGENIDRDPDLDAFKGLEVNGFLFEEINECTKAMFKKAIERSGTWFMPWLPETHQPKPIILATCNPTDNWVKDDVYDPWESGYLRSNWCYIQATADDNPHVPLAVREAWKDLPKADYEVYVKGNWNMKVKTPDAFWYNFDFARHVSPSKNINTEAIHISIDDNLHPYCTASIWQINKERKLIRQVAEIAAKTPNNQAYGLAKMIASWVKANRDSKSLFLYGDATTQKGSTIDPEKKSFADIIVNSLNKDHRVRKRFSSSNPAVSLTAEFVNELFDEYDGWRIEINESCAVSIRDYMSVRTDTDGRMLKERVKRNGISFEPYGHFSDTMRYFIHKVLLTEFNAWKSRHSKVFAIPRGYREDADQYQAI